ncbi:MAG: molybdenum cofactor guanylyltransferase [Actinomycetota bacterium]
MVLAGGRSSRFGSDKLIHPYEGAPLLQHAVMGLSEVCAEVIVVLAPGAPEPAFLAELPVRFAHDAVAGEGPLAGLAAGLEAVTTDVALGSGGDMPSPVLAVLREMLHVAGEAPVDAVALRDGERFRPLPTVVRSGAASRNARTLLERGERSLRALLDSLSVAVIDAETWQALDPDRSTLRDIDTPGDLPRR